MALELIHNACFQCDARSADKLATGVYRVILDDPQLQKIVVVRIAPEKERPPKTVETDAAETKPVKKKRNRKPPPPLVGDLLWADRDVLIDLRDRGLLAAVEIERENVDEPTKEGQIEEYDRRCRAMACFLDYERLVDGILLHHGLGGLVADARAVDGASRSYVYALWSLLCRKGLLLSSLIPRHDLKGAPGVSRPCDPDGREKAGRKTKEQRVARDTLNVILPPKQPGMSSEWTFRILAADRAIKLPKPRMPVRCNVILKDFRTKIVEIDGRTELVLPELGSYPTDEQIARVLTSNLTELERIREKTTKQHFQRSQRGLTGRNWMGVAGPGHTWAIDSTIADMHLRSSVNRNWIIGRPIVYVIVDVWSTAVVGFYVCLTGPSWDTAKVSLFNAVASAELMGELWGCQWQATLDPAPTLCFALMCDRGEYLSAKHRVTAMKLLPLTSYAMPYRPDLKGLVEVLHRIEKDSQFQFFVPGAIDARRKEMELKRADPSKSVLTLAQYTRYLHEMFSMYNLTADRSERLDAHMIAAGVYPSPSGLWRWGHQVGIGVRRQIPESELISELLPHSMATVGRSSVRHVRCDYMSEEIKQDQWTTIARNLGSWDIRTHYYPGSMSRIWTPNPAASGMLKLELWDESRASPETSYDEWLDALAIQTMRRPQEKHEAKEIIQTSMDRMQAIVDSGRRETADALAKAAGSKPPPIREARAAEIAAQTSSDRKPSKAKVAENLRNEAFAAYYAAYSDVMKRVSA